MLKSSIKGGSACKWVKLNNWEYLELSISFLSFNAISADNFGKALKINFKKSFQFVSAEFKNSFFSNVDKKVLDKFGSREIR